MEKDACLRVPASPARAAQPLRFSAYGRDSALLAAAPVATPTPTATLGCWPNATIFEKWHRSLSDPNKEFCCLFLKREREQTVFSFPFV